LGRSALLRLMVRVDSVSYFPIRQAMLDPREGRTSLWLIRALLCHIPD